MKRLSQINRELEGDWTSFLGPERLSDISDGDIGWTSAITFPAQGPFLHPQSICEHRVPDSFGAYDPTREPKVLGILKRAVDSCGAGSHEGKSFQCILGMI